MRSLNLAGSACEYTIHVIYIWELGYLNFTYLNFNMYSVYICDLNLFYVLLVVYNVHILIIWLKKFKFVLL